MKFVESAATSSADGILAASRDNRSNHREAGVENIAPPLAPPSGIAAFLAPGGLPGVRAGRN